MRTLLAAILLIAASPMSAQDADLLRPFDYDKNAPLGIQETDVDHRGDVAIHDISYASPKSGLVPAYLVVPGGKGPFAAVIWGHWYMAGSAFLNRKEFLDEAVALAPAGVVSLLTDGPIARPGHVQDQDPLSTQQVTDRIQQIVDMRRGADLLLARPDIDPKRLAYVGHSYDAEIGGFLSGIDKRFKAFVLMAGGLSDEQDLKSKEVQEERRKIGAEKFDAFVAKYSWLDPGKFVSRAAPAVVFLQYATQEDFLTPERARGYAAIVSEPKRLKLYDAPHALNAEARRDRVAFLIEELQLQPVDPVVIARIPDLVQPPEPKQLQAPGRIDGVVTTKDGQPLGGVKVFGSLSETCCPVKRELVTSDQDGRFQLQHPGTVLHFRKDGFRPLSFVVKNGTLEIRVALEPSADNLQLVSCKKPRRGLKRIGWGNGLQFDVLKSAVKISGGKPDVDYVKYVIRSKVGGSYLVLGFGPYAMDTEPGDDLFTNSASFTQRDVAADKRVLGDWSVEDHGVVGMDSRGQLRNGGSWRHTAILEKGAEYQNASAQDAKLFDRIVDSLCWVPYLNR